MLTWATTVAGARNPRREIDGGTDSGIVSLPRPGPSAEIVAIRFCLSMAVMTPASSSGSSA
jgi:hypothetical protein